MKIFITLFLSLLVTLLNAQGQLVYQKKIYELPTPRFSHLYNSEKAVDSGYILSGYSNTTSNLAGYIFIVKIDELGDTVWTRRYDGPEYEYGYVKNLYDSSYVLYGQLYSFNPCDQEDMFLMKLKANGDTLWTRHYGTCYPDNPKQLVKGPNGGYYLMGTIDSGSDPLGLMLLRLDALGDTLWTKSIDASGIGIQQNHSCIASPDGGVLVSGFIYDSMYAPYSSYLMKIDSSGNLQWDKYFDNPYSNQIYQIINSVNGFYLIGGCYLGGIMPFGTMLVKIDFNGNLIFGKMYESISIYSNGVTLIGNESLLFAGTKQRGPIVAGQNNTDLVSLKIDSTGNLFWAKKYVTNQLGFGAYSSINSMQTNDNGFLITTTSTTDPTYNTYNGFLSKIDSLGNGCSDSLLTINVVDITSLIVTSDTINPVIGYYPVIVGRSPFNYYGSGINYTDLCNGYVGVEEEKNIEANDLFIYPNPARNQITIEVEILRGNDNSITITNIFGQIIKTIDIKKFLISKNKMEIDINDLPNGLFFIQFYGNKTLLCKKFIKQ